MNKIFLKLKTNILNKKGQAAAMDALIFLSIVAIVFVFILGYSMNYGTSVMDSAKKLYNNNFHYSALKAFMSASYGRDQKDILYSNAQDSVATMIKEDYGANSLKLSKDPDNYDKKNLISNNTKIAVLKTLSDLFRILPQRSYLLLISHDTSQAGGNALYPLILFLHTMDADEQIKSFVCYPDKDSIEVYLRKHTLDLEVAEGNFVLYRNLLSGDSTNYPSLQESGSLFLASWITNTETTDIMTELVCDDAQETLNLS